MLFYGRKCAQEKIFDPQIVTLDKTCYFGVKKHVKKFRNFLASCKLIFSKGHRRGQKIELGFRRNHSVHRNKIDNTLIKENERYQIGLSFSIVSVGRTDLVPWTIQTISL